MSSTATIKARRSTSPSTSGWRSLAALLLVAIAAWLFWDHPAVWPLKITVVFFHELGHAIAALATGGSVKAIELSADQGGLTTTTGGYRFVVLNAGYLGSLCAGVALLAAGRGEKTARWGSRALAAIFLISTLMWVRPVMSFGFGFAAILSASAVTVAHKGSDRVNRAIMRGLGVFSVLYALWDIRADVFGGSTGMSDAAALAQLTQVPASVWGVAWLLIGVGTLWRLRRWWL